MPVKLLANSTLSIALLTFMCQNKSFKNNFDITVSARYELISIFLVDEESSTNSDLTLAYANRSAAYFHLKKYQACLLDINRAFSIKYPQELQYKLYDRQARCFIHLKQYTAANTAFKNAKNALPLSRLDAKKCAFWEKEFAKGLSSCKQLNISESFSESDRTAKLAPDLSECHNDTFVSLNATCEVSYTKDEGR